MSLYYSHFLVPLLPEYRPNAVDITNFVQGIIDRGNVAIAATISFARIEKVEGRLREIQNAFTGKISMIQSPSRRVKPLTKSFDLSQLVELAANQTEYDVSIVGEGLPRNPPLDIGYSENGEWKTMNSPYHLEIRCRVRAHIVRLHYLENETELDAPPDLLNFRPRFDEDCTLDDRDGVFVHPEAGAIRIPNAGCGMFWLEFNYGKHIFPRLGHNGVNLLTESVTKLAQNAFATDFVQACNWG